jgi:uncharacterized membrane protein YphA (DoxX/SURF4 family)
MRGPRVSSTTRIQSRPKATIIALNDSGSPFVEFIGGVLLIVGLATRYASLLILLFIIIATFSTHRYWE